METGPSSEALNRIILISLALGMMLGVAIVLVLRTVADRDVRRLAVLAPLLLIGIPMAVAMLRMRQAALGGGGKNVPAAEGEAGAGKR